MPWVIPQGKWNQRMFQKFYKLFFFDQIQKWGKTDVVRFTDLLSEKVRSMSQFRSCMLPLTHSHHCSPYVLRTGAGCLAFLLTRNKSRESTAFTDPAIQKGVLRHP